MPDPDGVGGDDPPETAFSFDAAGNLLTVTDALGNVTEYQYDNLFRQILVIAADRDGGGGLASPETEFSYDLLGRLTSMTDALDRVTSYEYDVLGRRIKVVQPDPDGVGGEDAPETDYEYDLAGNLVSVTDPLGNVTTYAYDNLYRRVSTTQPDPDAGGALSAPVTSFSYDAAGNMTSLTDPVGNVTSWVYDAHNRTIEETNELSDTRYFEYDVAGNLIEKTDRNGLVTQFTYDDLYRLTTETWKDGETTVNTLDFTYDAASQMLTASDDFSSYEYTYNGLGQVTLIEIDNGGPLVELAQEFTPVGSRSLLAASFDDGGGMDDDFQNIFYYDNIQRLVQIDQSGVQGGNTVAEKRVNFAYNAAGQFTSIDRYKDLDGGAGNLVVETDFVYDGIGRLTDLTHVHDTTTIADYDWTFDAFSRVTSMSFTSLVGNDGSSTYDYDETNQLTSADHEFQTDESYTYDENGNRTISGYSTGDNNLLSTDGTYNYSYDEEGNRVLKTNISTGDYTEYEWDHRNRLTRIAQYNSSDTLLHDVEYTYDLFNRRITKEIDADGAGAGGIETTQYIYDDDDIILAFDGADALTNRYLHGPLVDQILADEDALGDVLWPLPDNLGSVRDLVDSDGDVQNHLTYDAYGNITSETAPSVFHIYAYTGRERDEESDLQFNRARYYDAAIAGWISEDPIGFEAADSNLRRYVLNSPTNGTDPTGLQTAGPTANGNVVRLHGLLNYTIDAVRIRINGTNWDLDRTVRIPPPGFAPFNPTNPATWTAFTTAWNALMNRNASTSQSRITARVACNQIFHLLSEEQRQRLSLIDVEIQVHITNVDYTVMRPGETAFHRDGDGTPDLWVTVVQATQFPGDTPYPPIDEDATFLMIINIVDLALQSSTLGAGGGNAFLAAVREAVP